MLYWAEHIARRGKEETFFGVAGSRNVVSGCV